MNPLAGVRGAARDEGHEGGEPEAIRIQLLGGFRVSVGARIIEQSEWRLRKAASVVKLLTLAPSHHLHREQVMNRLWPGSGRKAASNNLRRVLHAARKVLDPDLGSRYLVSEDESLVLCPKSDLWVDVEAFEASASSARRSRDPAAYRSTVHLYTGDLLPGNLYEEWAEDRRVELRNKYLMLLIELSKLREERGDSGSAIEVLQEVVTSEPHYEKAHFNLMRLYAEAGQRYRAMQQYDRLRQSLARELGTEPEAASRHLYEEIVAGHVPTTGQPTDSLPTKVYGAGDHNLPATRTSFVGRERALVELKRTLAMARLLTLTGAGGCGKTRLAMEVARDLVGTYPDGAWLVELAPQSRPELLPQTVAAALGVRERSHRSPTDALVDFLRTRTLLLVLDNCEHLLDACARLADTLLASCPGLRILTTSREALRVAGEVIWLVRPLSLPEVRGPTAIHELEGSESVRLFMERVRYRQPAFVLTTQNVSAVAEICRQLDGIPLAIELAAARVGAMSVEQIAARLGDPLGLLIRGNRTDRPGHRTFRETLEWSYWLLSEPERKLFAQLSVFVGGCTLEAAETVVSGSYLGGGKVLDLLSELVDKSLVTAEAAGDGGLRYRLLEPIRQYALERLEESGQLEVTRRYHTRFYLAEAETAEPELTGLRQTWWLDRLESEYGNLRAALSWSLERGDELGLQLGSVLWRFWYMRGYLSEGRKWLEEALAESHTGSPSVRAKALDGAGWLAETQGDYESARSLYEESLELAQSSGDREIVASSLGSLGSVALSQGDHERARALLEKSLSLLRELGNERSVFSGLNTLAAVASSQGDHDRAMILYQEALRLGRKVGDAQGIAISLGNLGFTTLVYGDQERAQALLEESLARLQKVGDTWDVAICLNNLGLAALSREDHESAAMQLQKSLKISRELGDMVGIARGLEGMAAVAATRRKAQLAARLWGAAQALREDLGAPIPPDEDAILESYWTAARDQLDEPVWEIEWAKGRAMTAEQALEYVLFTEDLSPAASVTPGDLSVSGQQAALTRREEEVAVLVARGLTNREVAAELVISEHTAATHLRRILKKLGLQSRAQIGSWMSGEQQGPIQT